MEQLATEQRLPLNFIRPYTVEWGEDDYGLYQVMALFGVEHTLRWVPPGVFQMGSPENEKGRLNWETQHWVSLSQGFWLGETAVSQQQWMAAKTTKTNPSHFKGKDHPVDSVSWEDCQVFMAKLNSSYKELGARLPTEAEWEYACRAGTASPFYWGDDISLAQANYRGTWEYKKEFAKGALQATCPIKAYRPNALGLYQMCGNVWEWCNDWYADYPKGEVMDPEGPAKPAASDDTARRVLRGGSWGNDGRCLRAAGRLGLLPVLRSHDGGFRLALGRELSGGGAANKGR